MSKVLDFPSYIDQKSSSDITARWQQYFVYLQSQHASVCRICLSKCKQKQTYWSSATLVNKGFKVLDMATINLEGRSTR